MVTAAGDMCNGTIPKDVIDKEGKTNIQEESESSKSVIQRSTRSNKKVPPIRFGQSVTQHVLHSVDGEM